MAPELLSGDGSVSNSSDVYSFGILMFEIYRGIEAFSETRHPNFDEIVIFHNHRPTFPPDTPDGYKDLATACWSKDRLARPSFAAIVSSLTQLRADEGGQTTLLEISSSSINALPPGESSSNLYIPVVPPRGQSLNQEESRPRHNPELTTNDKAFWEAVFNY